MKRHCRRYHRVKNDLPESCSRLARAPGLEPPQNVSKFHCLPHRVHHSPPGTTNDDCEILLLSYAGHKEKKNRTVRTSVFFLPFVFFLLNFQLRYFCVVRRRKAMLDVASWLTASSSLATHMASTWSNAYTRRNKEREFPLPKNNSSRKGLWEGQSV